jgi:hypothetical protein
MSSLGTHSLKCHPYICRYTFREPPVETEVPNTGICHFLVKIYPEDMLRWLRVLSSSPFNRLVHRDHDVLMISVSRRALFAATYDGGHFSRRCI